MRPSVAVGLLSLLAAVPQPADAFLPTETRSLHGRLGVSHIVQTRKAVESLWGTFFGLGFGTSKMQDAREEIADANADVDDDQEHAELHFDGESFIKGQLRLIDLSKNVVGFMRKSPRPDDYAARKLLGQALHTLQDFYSHTNWIEMLKENNRALVPHPGLGVEGSNFAPLGQNVATCSECENWPLCGDCKGNLVTQGLTSGYYSGEPEFPKPGDWKCSHGGPFDGSSGGFFSGNRGQGINKDSSDCLLSPHHHLHDESAAVSIEATKKFITEIRNQLTSDQTKLLFGVKTRSSIWNIFPFSAGGLIIDIIDKIRHHHDDDDKRDLSSLEKRVPISEHNSHTFVHAREVHEHARLLTRAAATGKVHPIRMVRRDGEPDESAIGWKDIALATGGQPLEISEDETEEAERLLDIITQEDYVEILNVAGSPAKKSKKVEYKFPVDSAMQSLVISASGVSAFQVYLPNGSRLPTKTNEKKGITVAQLSSNLALNMTSAPAVGNYRVVLTCIGDYTLSVSGKSVLNLSSFAFTQQGGRAGHEGFFPIATSPISGQVFPIEAFVDGEFKNPKFEFRSKSNTVIATQAYAETGSEEGMIGNMFEGNSTAIPEEDFMVYMTGVDSKGKPFQRAYLNMVTPSKVTISFPRCETLFTGVKKNVRVTIQNLNKIPDTFTITAIDEKNVITKVSKTSMSLRAGAKGHFDITLDPGSDVSTGTNHMVILVEGKKTRANTAIVKMVVEPKSYTEQNKVSYDVYYANETMALIEDEKFKRAV